MTKAEMLDRIRLSPFNFDDIEYNTVYIAFYATLPGIGENGNGNGNNSGSGGDSNGITPPILSCSLKMPCTGSITSAWGYRESPITPGKQELHTGMDISGEWHQPIYATFAGEVISASTTKSGYGNFVQIKHSSDNITFYSFYAHLSKLCKMWNTFFQQSNKRKSAVGFHVNPKKKTAPPYQLLLQVFVRELAQPHKLCAL